MLKKDDIIEFTLSRIITEQFALLEEITNVNDPLSVVIMFAFAFQKDDHLCAIKTNVKFEKEEKTLIILEASTHFHIKKDTWEKFRNENGESILPKDFIAHLSGISLGITRGIFHAKVEQTSYASLVIPLINVSQQITEDFNIDNPNYLIAD